MLSLAILKQQLKTNTRLMAVLEYGGMAINHYLINLIGMMSLEELKLMTL